MEWENWLHFCAQMGASDLHLADGMPPAVRIDGVIQALRLPENESGDAPVWQGQYVGSLLRQIMNAEQYAEFERHWEADFALACGAGRFRVNAFYKNGGAAAVLRRIPCSIPDLDTLNAPAVLHEISGSRNGLVLVTGATGSGKSTTLAAMVDFINRHRAAHILTIEDPIEFVHTPQRAIISQRQLHQHTHSFAAALRAALREDPDVILIGEMRDPETIRLALTAAETGHLVLATLHTSGAVKSVDRMIDVFSAGEKEMVRTMLAESLRAVIAQILLPRTDGSGRVAAYEIMVSTPAVRNLIRENKTAQLQSVLQTGRAVGMQTMAQSVEELVRRGVVSADCLARL